MSYTPTSETLELAAIAMGADIWKVNSVGVWLTNNTDVVWLWQPHLPTTQGKADLQDLQLALPMDVEWFEEVKMVVVEYHAPDDVVYAKGVNIRNGNKHAALAKAVLEVAALVGAKMKEKL